MTRLGILSISKPIDKAVSEIREWLSKIGVNGMGIDFRYDANSNIALLRFNYKGKNYEFRSTRQKNCRLNAWAIQRCMESKVRNHIMEIEPFEKSMVAYILLEGSVGQATPQEADESLYQTLGLNSLASNPEIETTFKHLAKQYHPDKSQNEAEKKYFEEKFSQITNAYQSIKKSRGL